MGWECTWSPCTAIPSPLKAQRLVLAKDFLSATGQEWAQDQLCLGTTHFPGALGSQLPAQNCHGIRKNMG